MKEFAKQAAKSTPPNEFHIAEELCKDNRQLG